MSSVLSTITQVQSNGVFFLGKRYICANGNHLPTNVAMMGMHNF